MLALGSGGPIITVGLSGTRNVVLQGSCRFHAAHVGIVLGDPIATENLTLDDRDWLIQRVKSEIQLAQNRALMMGGIPI